MTRLIETPLYEAIITENTLFIVLKDDTTDAALGHLDNPPPNRNANGIVNFYEEADEKVDRLWRSKLGGFVYKDVVKADLEKEGIQFTPPGTILLAAFPQHYRLWVHKKGGAHDPRQDRYLYGSRFVHQFRSSAEFFPHLKWLLDGQPMKGDGQPDCKCVYCDGSRPQREISKEMGVYHQNKRNAHNGGGRGGRGRRGGRGPRPQVAPNDIPFKDYRKFD